MQKQLEKLELKHAEDKLELEVNLKEEYHRKVSEVEASAQSDTMVGTNSRLKLFCKSLGITLTLLLKFTKKGLPKQCHSHVQYSSVADQALKISTQIIGKNVGMQDYLLEYIPVIMKQTLTKLCHSTFSCVLHF